MPEVDIYETEGVHELKMHLEGPPIRAGQMEDPRLQTANPTARLDCLIWKSGQLLVKQPATHLLPKIATLIEARCF